MIQRTLDLEENILKLRKLIFLTIAVVSESCPFIDMVSNNASYHQIEGDSKATGSSLGMTIMLTASCILLK